MDKKEIHKRVLEHSKKYGMGKEIFEEGFVEGQLKEKRKWVNFVEALNVVCDYPKDFQKEIIKEVKKEKKELV
jgi:hypothetical protein